jgi:hypothetical protein
MAYKQVCPTCRLHYDKDERRPWMLACKHVRCMPCIRDNICDVPNTLFKKAIVCPYCEQPTHPNHGLRDVSFILDPMPAKKHERLDKVKKEPSTKKARTNAVPEATLRLEEGPFLVTDHTVTHVVLHVPSQIPCKKPATPRAKPKKDGDSKKTTKKTLKCPTTPKVAAKKTIVKKDTAPKKKPTKKATTPKKTATPKKKPTKKATAPTKATKTTAKVASK